MIPVNLTVYFQSGEKKFEAGNFSLFPPNRPGKFKFRISQIINEIKSNFSNEELNSIKLCLELKLNDNDKIYDIDKGKLELKIKNPQFTSE